MAGCLQIRPNKAMDRTYNPIRFTSISDQKWNKSEMLYLQCNDELGFGFLAFVRFPWDDIYWATNCSNCRERGLYFSVKTTRFKFVKLQCWLIMLEAVARYTLPVLPYKSILSSVRLSWKKNLSREPVYFAFRLPATRFLAFQHLQYDKLLVYGSIVLFSALGHAVQE